MWINTASWRDRWGLVHEFTHSLQFHSGGSLEIWPAAVSKGVFHGMVIPERLDDPPYASLRTRPMREVSCVFSQDPVSLLWACVP